MNEKTLALSKTPQELATLVEIPPNAVVSRTLISKPAGTVTLFVFDAGEALSEHIAPYDALVQAIEGEVYIHVASQAHMRISTGRAHHSAACERAARCPCRRAVQNAGGRNSPNG